MPLWSRRCGSCGRGPGLKPSNKLVSVSSIREFLSLVDSNAPYKKYLRIFGLSHVELEYHLKKIKMYRQTVAAADRIAELIKGGAENQEEMNRLRRQMWINNE